MAIDLTVNNTVISYPEPNEPPGWGEGATEFAIQVAEVLNDLVNSNDILETSFTIQNNIAVFTNIAGLSFSTGEVRSASISYSIYRYSDSTPSGNAETGSIDIVYDDNAPVTEKWLISVNSAVGNSGVIFSITDAGQVQYQSTDIGSSNYFGEMKFRAKTILSI